jgi:hypothetical protein
LDCCLVGPRILTYSKLHLTFLNFKKMKVVRNKNTL